MSPPLSLSFSLYLCVLDLQPLCMFDGNLLLTPSTQRRVFRIAPASVVTPRKSHFVACVLAPVSIVRAYNIYHQVLPQASEKTAAGVVRSRRRVLDPRGGARARIVGRAFLRYLQGGRGRNKRGHEQQEKNRKAGGRAALSMNSPGARRAVHRPHVTDLLGSIWGSV